MPLESERIHARYVNGSSTSRLQDGLILGRSKSRNFAAVVTLTTFHTDRMRTAAKAEVIQTSFHTDRMRTAA
jgi:hypothetical protein